MNAERPPHALDTCPAADVLTAYSVGKLPVEQTRTIAEHVERCRRCEDALDRVDSDDTLVAALQRHVPRPTTGDLVREAFRGAAGDPGLSRGRMGPYELLEKIGQGAMGVVYRARQVRLNRLVALKVALTGGLVPVEALARFRTESESIARLAHPNIVCVHDCGEQDGQPYFSMELVEGQSLAEKLRQGPLSEQEAAELVQTLAGAVAFAHRQEVIHRDLKPANVLLASDGTVKLTDFGLAKLLDVEGGQTQREAVLGTASYMAPEQASGNLAAVGPLADVYGLGAILYEALTGRPPFRAATRSETLRQVQTQAPLAPSRLRPRLSRCLEAICLKCLEKEPHDRYSGAAALADDLERWRQHRPTLARPVGPLLRCGKAIRRRPRLAAAVALGAMAVVALAVVWTALAPERRYQRRVAPLLARLERGEAVELIEPGKDLPPFRVRCGEGTTRVQRTADGLTIRSPVLGLVEFLPRVPPARYRLHAELRHDETFYGPFRDAEVGVSFSHRSVFASNGGHHVIATVSLNDWDRRNNRGREQSRATTHLLWHLDTPVDSPFPDKHRLCYPPRHNAWYNPTAPGKDWHTIVLDVGPEGATAILGDSPGQTMRLPAPDLFDWFSRTLRERQAEASGVDFGPLNQPAIGVLVIEGQCTLRRLRIVPQPEAVP